MPSLISLVLIALGAAVLIYAPAIQRFGVARSGRPRGPFAFSLKVAASDLALFSIRMSGAIWLLAGVALLVAMIARAS